MLAEYLTNEIYAGFLIFCRVGMAMMVLPVFNSGYLSPRIRLVIAITISIVIAPLINNMPEVTANTTIMVYHIFSEIFIGFLIGSIARFIAVSIHVAGMIMTMQAALAQAVLFDPNQSAQGALFGNFMELMAITLIFTFNLHHLMILAITDSYMVFPPAGSLPLGDFADAAIIAFSKSFVIGVQLAAPLIVAGLLVNLSSGLLARLMPSFQVFFVIMPVQIMTSIFIFSATLSAIMMWYMDYLHDAFSSFMTF